MYHWSFAGFSAQRCGFKSKSGPFVAYHSFSLTTYFLSHLKLSFHSRIKKSLKNMLKKHITDQYAT